MVLISVPLIFRKEIAQDAAMFFEQLQRERFITLAQSAVTDHLREHDGGEFALFGAGAHQQRAAA